MILKRRNKSSLWMRFRDIVWPRMGWRRAFSYLGQRIRRLPDTPHRISLGFACGILASFTPFFGLHFIIAALFAWIVGGNIISSTFGTFIGNPVTFPLIIATNIKVGSYIMGTDYNFDTQILTLENLVSEWRSLFLEVVLPYTVGGIGPGLITSVAVYFIIYPLIKAYQKRRRARLQQKIRKKIKDRTKSI